MKHLCISHTQEYENEYSFTRQLVYSLTHLCMKKKGIGLVVLLLGVFISNAQNDDIKIKEAKGEWVISNITPEQAYDKALVEAKFEALRIAGIDESINTINSLYSTNEGNDYTGISNIELGGEVIDFTVVEKKIVQEHHAGFEVLIAKVTINAVIRKYKKKRDSSFQIKVEGIERSYKDNDLLTFAFTPYKNGYLKIFAFEDDNSGYLLYPNNYEKNERFQAGLQVKFPISKEFDYKLVKINNSKTVENNLLIFVYTKNDVPFFEEEVNFHSVLNWIAKITPDERTEIRNLVQITKTKK
ncbi:MAG: DUF4384 domain-containing protein [Dysgonamonadaceae bacterium]|jgi:hypothetical protein|nr:DUF4384 domain-containing protein [Dysgonamonadaceae bacterium]